jgi:hypothetical protein
MDDEQIEALKIFCERQKLLISELTNKVLWLETRLELANKINIEQLQQEVVKDETQTKPQRKSQFLRG